MEVCIQKDHFSDHWHQFILFPNELKFCTHKFDENEKNRGWEDSLGILLQ